MMVAEQEMSFHSKSLARPLVLGHILALAIGFTVFCYVLGFRFALNDSPFILKPSGDLAAEQASYFLVMQDAWRWPILALPSVNVPEGANAFFLGGIPLVALLAKIIRQATGETVNFFGAWYCLCYTLQAHSFYFLVLRQTPAKPLLAAVSSILGVLAYAFLIRFGHVSLQGQFLVIYAIAFAVSAAQERHSWKGSIAAIIALDVAALYIFAYLAVSITAVLAAALANLWARRVTPVYNVLFAGLVGVFVIGGSGWIGGLFSAARQAAPTGPTANGQLALNLYGLVRPPQSILFPDHLVAMPYWEGTFYLGIGVLALLVLNFLVDPRRVVDVLSRNWAFIVGLLVLTTYCLTNHISFGDDVLFHYDLPAFFNPVVGLARSAGRLFWPIGYLIMASAIALTIINFRFGSVPLVLIAVLVAASEATGTVQYVRDMKTMSLQMPLDWVGLETIMNEHRFLRLSPSFWCNPGKDIDDLRKVHAQLAFASARAHLGSNSAITVRPTKDCAREAGELEDTFLRPGELDMYLSERTARRAFEGHNEEVPDHCRMFNIDLDQAYVCAREWTAETLVPISQLRPADISVPPLAIGQRIEFTEGGNWQRFAGTGWQGSDGDVTWTNGKESSIFLDLPEGADRLVFSVYALLAPPRLPRRLTEVLINGRRIDSWVFEPAGWQERSLQIPADIDRSRPMKLTLVNDEIRSLAELGDPVGDPRHLALALKSILVTSGTP